MKLKWKYNKQCWLILNKFLLLSIVLSEWAKGIQIEIIWVNQATIPLLYGSILKNRVLDLKN